MGTENLIEFSKKLGLNELINDKMKCIIYHKKLKKDAIKKILDENGIIYNKSSKKETLLKILESI